MSCLEREKQEKKARLGKEIHFRNYSVINYSNFYFNL